ncbi:MAG TPA: hypothetical protein VK966_01400 [Longimicrobiales bacterium]|nr:hypothetical protein [Longimicrobiales bacterium]
MSMDELKELWQSQGTEGAPAPEAEVLATVKRKAADMEKTIRRRDRREVVVAVVVSAFFLPLLLEPSWVVRAGVLLYVATSGITWYRLRRARLSERDDPAASMLDTVRTERRRVEAQIQLLDSVAWWYVIPFALSVILIFGGLNGLTLLTAGYSVAVVLLGLFILHLNRAAVRDDLWPRHEELTRILASAER